MQLSTAKAIWHDQGSSFLQQDFNIATQPKNNNNEKRPWNQNDRGPKRWNEKLRLRHQGKEKWKLEEIKKKNPKECQEN